MNWIYETGPFEAVGVYGYFFGPTEIEYEIPTKGANVDGAYALRLNSDWTTSLKQPGRAGLCSGDSGGPLVVYKDDRMVVAGVEVDVVKNGCGDSNHTLQAASSNGSEMALMASVGS